MRHTWRYVRSWVVATRRDPSFASAVLVMVGLGVGLNTAIFTLLFQAVIRPLPYPDPQTLVQVGRVQAGTQGALRLSAYDYTTLHSRVSLVHMMGAYANATVTLHGSLTPTRLRATRTSASLFGTLGVSPALGRVFSPPDQESGGLYVVLSHSLWTHQFGADPQMVGKAVLLDDATYAVIGVMPPTFAFPSVDTQVWLPLGNQTGVAGNVARVEFYDVVARVKPSTSLTLARTEAEALLAAGRRGPSTDSGPLLLVPLNVYMTREFRQTLYLVQAGAGVVFLLVCLNLSMLAHARGARRGKEMAIRMSLGATRADVFWQLGVESLVLGCAGATAGLVVAAAGLPLLKAFLPADSARLNEVALDPLVVAFAVGLAWLGVLIATLIPGGRVMGTSLVGVVQSDSSPHFARRRWKPGGRAMLIAAETAASFALVAAAILIIANLQRLLATDLGYNPGQAVSARITLPEVRYRTLEARHAFLEDLLRAIERIPGVRMAAVANQLPLTGRNTLIAPSVESGPPAMDASSPSVGFRVVSPGYFDAMVLRQLDGRFLTHEDRIGSPPVVVVSASFATRYLRGLRSVGRHVQFAARSWEIVGVVGDVRHVSLQDAPGPEIYVSCHQIGYYPPAMQRLHLAGMDLLVRTSENDPAAILPALRRAVRSLDPQLATESEITLDRRIYESIRDRIVYTSLLTTFAVFALLVTAFAVFSVVAYVASERTREIAIRMAVGASRRDILVLLLRAGWLPAVAGLGVGLPAAAGVGRLLHTIIVPAVSTGPGALAGAGVILASVAAVAALVPARRAARLEPAAILQQSWR